MRKLFLAVFFVFVLYPWYLKAQSFKALAVSQRWANGVCCAHGTNYTVTLIGRMKPGQAPMISSICINKMEFSIEEIRSKVIKGEKGNKMEVYFSFSEDGDKQGGQTSNIKRQKECKKEGVTLILKGKEELIKYKEIKELPMEARP